MMDASDLGLGTMLCAAPAPSVGLSDFRECSARRHRKDLGDFIKALGKPLDYEVLEDVAVHDAPLSSAPTRRVLSKGDCVWAYPAGTAWLVIADGGLGDKGQMPWLVIAEGGLGEQWQWLPVTVGYGAERRRVLSPFWSELRVQRWSRSMEVSWSGIAPPHPLGAAYGLEWRLVEQRVPRGGKHSGRKLTCAPDAELHGLPEGAALQLRVTVRVLHPEDLGPDVALSGVWKNFATRAAPARSGVDRHGVRRGSCQASLCDDFALDGVSFHCLRCGRLDHCHQRLA